MKFSELEGAAVGAWGAGREIRSLRAALERHLPSARLAVIATDAPVPGAERTAFPGTRFVGAAEAVDALGACDAVVRSPGVSIYRDELQALDARGIPVTTSTSLWLAEDGGRGVIAVTGTKGKSTTATLTAHLLAGAGRSVHLAGNVGIPAIELLDRPAADHVVLELSSYQIADLAAGPRVAVFTNLYREHVDWHRGEAGYRRDKLRLAGLAGVELVVANAADPGLAELRASAGARLRTFGDAAGYHVDERALRHGDAVVAEIADLPFPGRHNALNLCAALAALAAVDVPAPRLPEALGGFRMLAHRLETIAVRDGVAWVNDSISTTPESALAALASYPDHRVILIAGGHDREQDYAALGRALALRSSIVLGLPATGARLVASARAAGVGDAELTADLPAAVAAARDRARPGDVVLLSPAAPSFGAYVDFEQRGAHFRALVHATAPE
ncbi:MAG: UDP-N-acetylmuramoyl-L-alanine---L-glutamate ligase [Solirubrobacteraceae bacterium]|jgi:UDP-N-acetylmuramoylalanine--D-glutamate ligase|nr:UDP-N-acetylmuramoyl-L-alanine---L-glutamate ligase [Solirubrobacteraceae bacterium]